jgi:RNA polymerase sigma-70 factor (ECF subfamily)
MQILGLARHDEDDLAGWLADGYATAYRTAYLILHNRQDAEEAVQDAFLRAWRFRAAVPPGEGVRPWLYRVVVNSCISKLRSNKTRKARTADFELADWDDPVERVGAPEQALEAREAQQLVCGVLAELPEHLRVVVVLRYFAQMSEREIAAAVHRRPGTVKSRLHEARVRLGRDPRLAAYHSVETPVGGEA